MLNIKNIQNLINVLEKSDSFLMDRYFYNKYAKHPCGTAACIVGHWKKIVTPGFEGDDIENKGKTISEFCRWMGVSKGEGYLITVPTNDIAHFSKTEEQEGFISKRMAIQMLERLIETGKVEWKPEEPEKEFPEVSQILDKVMKEERAKHRELELEKV